MVNEKKPQNKKIAKTEHPPLFVNKPQAEAKAKAEAQQLQQLQAEAEAKAKAKAKAEAEAQQQQPPPPPPPPAQLQQQAEAPPKKDVVILLMNCHGNLPVVVNETGKCDFVKFKCPVDLYRNTKAARQCYAFSTATELSYTYALIKLYTTKYKDFFISEKFQSGENITKYLLQQIQNDELPYNISPVVQKEKTINYIQTRSTTTQLGPLINYLVKESCDEPDNNRITENSINTVIINKYFAVEDVTDKDTSFLENGFQIIPGSLYNCGIAVMSNTIVGNTEGNTEYTIGDNLLKNNNYMDFVNSKKHRNNVFTYDMDVDNISNKQATVSLPYTHLNEILEYFYGKIVVILDYSCESYDDVKNITNPYTNKNALENIKQISCLKINNKDLNGGNLKYKKKASKIKSNKRKSNKRKTRKRKTRKRKTRKRKSKRRKTRKRKRKTKLKK